MSSLTNAIKLVQNLRGPISARTIPLSFPREELLNHYDENLLDLRNFETWNDGMLDWIRTEIVVEAENKILKRLCKTIARDLRLAISKIEQLRRWGLGVGQLPRGASCDRHVVLASLDDVLSALQAFKVVRHQPLLQKLHLREMVLVYLRKVLDFVVALDRLLCPEEKDREFFMAWEGILEEEDALDFMFDSESDYEVVDDRSLTGVICHQREVLDYYLSGGVPRAPVFYRNPYPYGPTILENARARRE